MSQVSKTSQQPSDTAPSPAELQEMQRAHMAGLQVWVTMGRDIGLDCDFKLARDAMTLVVMGWEIDLHVETGVATA